MKSKEELIKEYLPCTCGEIYLSRKMTAPDCPQHAFAVEELMDEYAKEMAMAFMDFVTRETSGFAVMYGDQEDRFADHDREYTIAEVFDLFLNYK